jgi:inner membrane transporter RhtA
MAALLVLCAALSTQTGQVFGKYLFGQTGPLGVVIAGMNLVYPAMRYLPVGVASTLQLLGPLTVALLGSRRPADLGIAALAAAGVWLVNDPGASVSWAGLVLALLGIPAGLWQNGTALLSPGLLLAGAGIAVLSAVLPYSLEQRALRRLRPGTVGVLLTTEPAIAGLAGTVVLNEHLSAARWLGIACISVAAATAVRTTLR